MKFKDAKWLAPLLFAAASLIAFCFFIYIVCTDQLFLNWLSKPIKDCSIGDALSIVVISCIAFKLNASSCNHEKQ